MDIPIEKKQAIQRNLGDVSNMYEDPKYLLLQPKVVPETSKRDN